MRAIGSGEVLPQKEAATAVGPFELRFYRLLDKGIKAVGVLELRGPMPPPPPQVDADAESAVLDDGDVERPQLEAGMYVALFQGGQLADLARLSSLEGQQPAAEAETLAEGETRGTACTSIEEDAAQEEGEGEEKCEEETEEEEEEESEEDDDDLYCVQVRMWPGQSRAVLIIFDKSYWVLTKGYNLSWLRKNEREELFSMIMEDANETVFSTYSRTFCSQLNFEGQLNLEDYYFSEMPRICYFGNGETAGGGATCGVHHFFYQDSYGNKSQCAIKVIKLTDNCIARMDNKEPREVEILSSLQGLNVPTFYQAWASVGYFKDYKKKGSSGEEDEDDDELAKLHFIQMEYCTSTIKDILYREKPMLTMEQSWELFKEIAEAVGQIHIKGIIHRDLKPDNIFVGSNGAIKIGDFGDACWAKNYNNGRVGTPNCGTNLYMAPELEDGPITSKVDVYSLGVIFVEIFQRFESLHHRYSDLSDLKRGIQLKDFIGDAYLLNKLVARCPSDRSSTNDLLDYIINKLSIIKGNNSAHPEQHEDATASSTMLRVTDAMVDMALEGSQFDAKLYDSKMQDMSTGETDELFTSYDEVVKSFEEMVLHKRIC